MDDFLEINAPEPTGPRRSASGGRNTLISAFRTWHSPHVHVLSASVKFAIRGEIDVETRRGTYRLTNRRFLFLNAYEPYTFQIAPKSAAQTCSLFFRSRYLASLERALTTRDGDLLELPPDDEALAPHLEYPEVLVPAGSHAVGARLIGLFNAWQAGASPHGLADRVRDVGEALIRLRSRCVAAREGIRAVKSSTRAELYRRVQVASLYVRENYTKDIDLNRVAREAGMAPHHLHRTFRAVNGMTLHQLIVGLRLDEAKRLVQETDLPIAHVCHRVGYASLPSFTHLFRARFGRPPAAFRRARGTS
ncbi:MAG TPA: AraC family transcriptional regulator [Gemmatimonadaceae bacterium]|nr:AraC family transcriptional regulator [Gemmatimonadaceae bacterium]